MEEQEIVAEQEIGVANDKFLPIIILKLINYWISGS
jgi:hypothetical protein